tara:strand:+ start:133 stop:696 length:564 start_codon:yes stop_codon:yes gene_type:complete
MSARARNRSLSGLNLRKSKRNTPSDTISKQGRREFQQTGLKIFDLVGKLMISVLKRKKEANLELSKDERGIMDILSKELNKSKPDKKNVRMLLKLLKRNSQVKVQDPFKNLLAKGASMKGGSRRYSPSSPVRELPEDNRPVFDFPRRYDDVNNHPIMLDLYKKQYYTEVAFVGVVLMLVCHGIMSLF